MQSKTRTLITVREAAELLNIKVITVRSWIDRGTIPPDIVKRFPNSSIVRLDRNRLEKWIDGRSAAGN